MYKDGKYYVRTLIRDDVSHFNITMFMCLYGPLCGLQTGNNVNHKEELPLATSPDDPSEHIKIIKIEKTNEPLGESSFLYFKHINISLEQSNPFLVFVFAKCNKRECPIRASTKDHHVMYSLLKSMLLIKEMVLFLF